MIGQINDFDSIRILIASPDEIKKWSYGEVTKPETINYRTQKPEKDGLFDERIFGPAKDYECYCGKYKKIRYKGVVCDKCGVEVTRSSVRRERMGHIELAVPISHIWYIRGVPSKVGLILDLSVRELESVIYFGNFIILEVSEEIRQKALEDLKKEYYSLKSQIKAGKPREEISFLKTNGGSSQSQKNSDLELAFLSAKNEIENLKPKMIISEKKYLDLSLKYGQLIKVGIGAEALRDLLGAIDLDKEISDLELEFKKKGNQSSKRVLKRLRLLLKMKKADIIPEWMVLTVLPVIPPDLRPMVQLDGGRFAASDLNDLYRRVINRNNRLKRLISQRAPEVICRNEKRMLQEAVDALIDNSARRDKAVVTTAGHRKLKSLSDMLKGKQGRFRQNLLGKRVDYSGRSVIVVGPELKLHQVGLPKIMALELFKPFVIARLISEGLAHNVKSASHLLELQTAEVWDILERITKNVRVLLNRAPTLHRLGIQAFQPVLIEGKAIQIHPLVCTAYNADFDGDQMAVYIPLSEQANFEAEKVMDSAKNLLKPASGKPIIAPTDDMVLGCYYLTKETNNAKGQGKIFSSPQEAVVAFENNLIDLKAKIKVKIENDILETTLGRIIFNTLLPPGMRFKNYYINKKQLQEVVAESFSKYGSKRTVELVDDIKRIGFYFAMISGITFSIDDIRTSPDKEKIINQSYQKASKIYKQFSKGIISDFERYIKTIDVWTKAKADIEKSMTDNFPIDNPILQMVTSGSRGSITQLTQVAGMKGLVANPAGDIIEIPIEANYKEGLSELEYFISSHGARKGKSDTALRTADAGYLTRRLVDVAQDVIISQVDCQDIEGITISKEECQMMGEDFKKYILGKTSLEKVMSPETGKKIIDAGDLIGFEQADDIEKSVSTLKVRSVLKCKAQRGVCQKCYGQDLATGNLVDLGVAAGIIAAQAIGEPGTQLTMRTFHIGGIAGEDITQGLPRVEELLEARTPKTPAVVAEIDGKVKIESQKGVKIIKIRSNQKKTEIYNTKGYHLRVKNGEMVRAKQVLATSPNRGNLRAIFDGKVMREKDKLVLESAYFLEVEYQVNPQIRLKVADSDWVSKGMTLTEGHWDLHKMIKLLPPEEVQKYILREIQDIYSSQGQEIHDKHIELIINKMFSQVVVKELGDTEFLFNQIVDTKQFENENLRLKAKNKKPAKGESILLGITKVALNTDSFLSAASFQETTSVLTEAATEGKIDQLKGLKENVIIGHLIPSGTGFLKSRIRDEMKQYVKNKKS